jgi:hypothetical protein
MLKMLVAAVFSVSTAIINDWLYCCAYSGDYYKTGIGLTTGFIGSHTVTHNYSVYTL